MKLSTNVKISQAEWKEGAMVITFALVQSRHTLTQAQACLEIWCKDFPKFWMVYFDIEAQLVILLPKMSKGSAFQIE